MTHRRCPVYGGSRGRAGPGHPADLVVPSLAAPRPPRSPASASRSDPVNTGWPRTRAVEGIVAAIGHATIRKRGTITTTITTCARPTLRGW